jgi:uncharacterized protein
MKHVDTVKAILAGHKEELRERFSVKDIGVFGSYVKGKQHARSDIDVLVEFEKPVGLFDFMALEEYLSSLLGAKVDLVSKKALKPKIGERILSEVIYA